MTVSPKAEITNQFHYVQRAKRVISHWNNVPRGTKKVTPYVEQGRIRKGSHGDIEKYR